MSTIAKRSLPKSESKLVMAYMFVAFTSLFIGATAGLLQTLERSGKFTLPSFISYYQILTVHGVILGLVLTTFFILGFMLSAQSKTTGGYNKTERLLAWTSFYVMLTGVIMATVMILMNEATVLYTFYAPLQAHVIFYICLALVLVGSWIDAFVIFKRHARFRIENPGERTTSLRYMDVIAMFIWQILSIGAAVTVVGQTIPWALGWVDGINVLLSSPLFWYSGHPLVYLWLIPAYMMW